MGVSILVLHRHFPLIILSIVEMTVGVMCSCFISFPGFCRYHLPLIRSILSSLRSSFKNLDFSRLKNRSSDHTNTPGTESSAAKQLAPKNLTVILGSQMDGIGRFASPASIFAKDPDMLPLSESSLDSPTHTDKASEPTNREFCEVAGEHHSQVRYPTAPHEHLSQQSRIRKPSSAETKFRLPNSGQAPKKKQSNDRGNVWWKMSRQSNTTRTGYWDIMSLFRIDTTMSSGQVNIHSESHSDAV